MQNPFDKISQAAQQIQSVQQQTSNPLGRVQNEATFVKMQINRGTANVLSALCYVTGVFSLIVGLNKTWREDNQIHYHAVHARVLWTMMLICAITIIGIPIAILLYLVGFYMASIAVNGGAMRLPLLTDMIYQRHWLN